MSASSPVAIVTRSAGDLGRGVCLALSKAGTTIVVLHLDVSAAEGPAET